MHMVNVTEYIQIATEKNAVQGCESMAELLLQVPPQRQNLNGPITNRDVQRCRYTHTRSDHVRCPLRRKYEHEKDER